MSGRTPRIADTTTVPTIPRNKLTANEIRVPTNVTSTTRTGIVYQRGERPWGFGGMLLTYTIHDAVIELSCRTGKS
jgi:hypothetical protein